MNVWEGAAADSIDTEREPDRSSSFKTDDEGNFKATLEAPHAAAILIVKPTGEFPDGREYAQHHARAVVAPGDRPEPLEVRLQLLDAVLVGTVRNDAGEPIEGARVWLWGTPEVTDAEGRYRKALRSGRQVFVYADAPGYAQERATVRSIAAGQEVELAFDLKAEFRVEGVVRDQLGAPVADAWVTSFYTNENDARTDLAGRYVLGRLDPGRPKHLVHVRKEGWVLTQVEVATEPDGVAVQDFTLDRGVRVVGRVVDAKGAAVAGAALYIGFSPHAFDRLDAESAADGSFVFPSVQRGSEYLVVQREGFGPYRQVITMPEDRDLLEGVEVRLEEGHFVAGRVRDEAGDALEGVWVSVRYGGEHLEARGETDPTGRFRIEDLPGNDLELSFYAPERALQRVRHVLEAVDRDDLEITMAAAGSLAGRVIDQATGLPIESFRVRFVEPELGPGEERLMGYAATWAREGMLFDGPDGTWNTGDASDLVPGLVIGIEVRAEGYAPAFAPRVTVELEPDPADFTLRLGPGSVVSGAVVDALDGAPVVGSTLKLYRADESISFVDSEDTYERVLTQTGVGGAFRFDHVAPGAYRILVLASGRPEHVDGPFEVGTEHRAERVIELSAGASLSGILRDHEGRARAGVTLELTPDWKPDSAVHRTRRTTTDELGAFRFDGLAPGSIRIGPRVVHEGLELFEYQVLVELSPSQARDLVLQPPGTARLVGRVGLAASGAALPEVLPVRLFHATQERPGHTPLPVFAGLARNGFFELHGLTPGAYELGIEWVDFATRTRWSSPAAVEVELEAGSMSEVTLEVERSSL